MTMVYNEYYYVICIVNRKWLDMYIVLAIVKAIVIGFFQLYEYQLLENKFYIISITHRGVTIHDLGVSITIQ